MDKSQLCKMLQEVYGCDIKALPTQLARMTPMIRKDVCNKLGLADTATRISVQLGQKKKVTVHA